jgi:MerR family transcriptional regulator, light-induced transcriptional regulator
MIEQLPAPGPAAQAASTSEPRYRSGAVARMAGIPVSTLRIWERRYQVAAPPLTPSGHRLYAAHDVQRLALIKRLVGLGHAIGTLARLGLPELEQLAASRVATLQSALPSAQRGAGRRCSFVVVGSGLAQRLARGGSRPSALAAGLERVAACADLTQAEATVDGVSAELLLVQLATLHGESADRVLALARRIGAQRVIVLYRFGPERAVQALQAAGAVARREPVPDAELAALCALAPRAEPVGFPSVAQAEPAPPRRFSDAALAEIAARSTTVACECPRHVAELVGQLASFEIYSAECLNRNSDDAALHADLNRVAATARALFEAALERVALAEGFELPAALAR